MKEVSIYTDGACSKNPGPGGWASVLLFGEHRKEISGYISSTTNNRMELTAAIEGLRALREPCSITLYSDSSYLINAFVKRWIVNWKRNDWLKSDKKPVENKDLWLELLQAVEPHKVKWIHVRGHADNVENNRCDKLATEAIKNHRE